MKILVVDDHLLFREGLDLLLRRLGVPVKPIHAGTPDEALAAVAHHPDLDLVLLDLILPGGGGLPLLDALRELAPTVPVVVISGSLEADHVRAALVAGAAGYIPKTLSSDEMLAALGQILTGGVYVPEAFLAALSGSGDCQLERPSAGDGAGE